MNHDDDILDRAKAALDGLTEGPWAAGGVLIGCELVKEAPGVTSYKYAIAEMVEDDYDEDGGMGVYDGEVFRTYEQMEADARFIAASRQLVPELVAEVEKLRGAAKTLGKLIDDSLTDVMSATDSHDLIGEDGDGDWMLVFERLMELRPARDAAIAEATRLRTALAEIGSLHTYVLDICDEYACGNCGGNPCETSEIIARHEKTDQS